MSKQIKYCNPRCNFFRCGRRDLFNRGRRIHCRWVEDDCSGPSCNYALCVRHSILPNGVCGLTIKRKTKIDELEIPTNNNVTVKVKGKLKNRLKDYEIF